MAVDSSPHTGEPLRVQLLNGAERVPATARLAPFARRNLALLDLVDPTREEARGQDWPAQVLGVFRGAELCGLAALRPSLVLESQLDEEGLEALLPYFEAVDTGLVKSPREVVDPLWRQLLRRGKRAVIDRVEHSLLLRSQDLPASSPPTDLTVRRAVPRDLEGLVHAARASLREEGRPDPFLGDPAGFRRWVQGRLARARVVESEGRVVFVGYADVRRPEGWLVQGVYTWPEHRRRGIARVGMAGIVREAGEAGADHVQLAVVEGNEAAVQLYRGLGFEAFDELRTILFV